jgi:hypothetical protein
MTVEKKKIKNITVKIKQIFYFKNMIIRTKQIFKNMSIRKILNIQKHKC